MMSNQINNPSFDNKHHSWQELVLPGLLYNDDSIRQLHAVIEHEWDQLRRSACQTAAGRALWKHVIHDPLADVLAGETCLRNTYDKIKKDCLNNASEISGVILAIRTLWFDSKLEAALSSFGTTTTGLSHSQVVLLGAGMDARAYRLSFLKESHVFEVDFPEVLQTKTSILQAAESSTTTEDQYRYPTMKAKSICRVAADITQNDWLEKLQKSGFDPKKNTVWVLEGILYYLPHSNAIGVLKIIADSCMLMTQNVLLADFMNKQSTSMCSSLFHFYSDWPEQLLTSLGFSDVKLSQLGDPDAHFGLLQDPQSLLNKLRGLPRCVQTHPDDGTPCYRLYLLQASGSTCNTPK